MFLRRPLGAWLVAAWLCRPAQAQAQDQRALFSVDVNHVPKGEALVVLRNADAGVDVLVGVQALEDLGVHRFGGTRESIGVTPHVSLTSLAPRLTYELDERALALHVTVQPELLEGIVRSFAAGRPPDIEFRRDASAFVNYAVDWREKNGYDVFTDIGASARGAFFGTGVSAASTERPLRGLSSVTFDQPGQLRRLVIGDAFANGGLLGGGMLLGGVTFSKEYSVDPYFIRYPTFNLSGAVTTPSIAEIYVNDRLVRTEPLAPGQFSLAQLPIVNGRNDARVVLRDAFGGVRDLSAKYYLTTTVLAPGLHEYQYSVGYQRTGFGVDSWSYGQPGFIARHRVGLTSNVTVGGRLEGTPNVISGGPALNVRTPFGELEAAGALSDAQGVRLGRAASVGYAYATQMFSAGGSLSLMTPQYKTTSSVAPQKVDASAFVSLRAGPRASLTLQSRNATPYVPDGAASATPVAAPLTRVAGALLSPSNVTLAALIPQRQTSLIGSARLTRRSDVSVTASLVKRSAGYVWNGSVGVNIRLDANTLAGVSVDRVDEIVESGRAANHVMTDIQRPLPLGIGFGYRFHSESGAIASGDLQYQGPFGRYELRRDVTDGAASMTLSASGGIVAINRGLYVTRPIQDAFALVRVPDVEGVRTYVNNQEVGRTDKHGDVLVPSLLSYYGNVLDISDEDVPLERTVGAVRKTVAPAYHGGALAVFPVHRVQGARGTIRIDHRGSLLTPAYGQLMVTYCSSGPCARDTANGTAASIESPIGEGGEFYLENVPPGRHEAIVEFVLNPGASSRRCLFTLDMPASNASSVELGPLRCVLSR